LTIAGRQWLTTVFLATHEAEIRIWRFEASPGKQFVKPYLEKTHHKKGLKEWLKVVYHGIKKIRLT
jgi:hypothetical protein